MLGMRGEEEEQPARRSAGEESAVSEGRCLLCLLGKWSGVTHRVV